jgi:hypothetical protein
MTEIETLMLPEMSDLWQQTLNWQPTAEQQQLFQQLYEGILEGNRQLNLTALPNLWILGKALVGFVAGVWSPTLKVGEVESQGTSEIAPTSLKAIDIGRVPDFQGYPSRSHFLITRLPYSIPPARKSPFSKRCWLNLALTMLQR